MDNEVVHNNIIRGVGGCALLDLNRLSSIY